MKEYLEKCFRRTVTIKEYDKMPEILPLRYADSYRMYTVCVDGIKWMLAQPKQEIRLNMLRHDWLQMQKAFDLNCAFCFQRLGYYTKETMMNEKIPFVIEYKQVFLPFVGMIFAEKANRSLRPVHEISFLTQKLLLCALYEQWRDMNVTMTAMKLSVTKTSVSRCFDEIEYLDIPILCTLGKSRKIEVTDDRKGLWRKICPILRNPVITRYELAEDRMLSQKAGITALCEYSMLADNPYPTYGITKKDLQSTGIRSIRRMSHGEEIGCIVLELGYFIEYGKRGIQDPVSVWLSLTDAEKKDERIAKSIAEMLKEYVW